MRPHLTPDSRLLFPLLPLLLACGGCANSTAATDAAADPARQEMVEELFDNAVGLLNELDEFDSGDALVQAVARMNQWLATKKPLTGWSADPLVASLPPDLQRLPAVESLAELKFARGEGLWLQEAVWLRDAARLAVGTETDDLRRAVRLFDWTVRNIQLEASEPPLPHLVYETLVLGRGTVLDRAWVFMLLARQQQLDVVLLATVPDGEPPRPWAAALLQGENLYLFDPELGLPIARADGQGVATLAQAAADPRVLDRLDLDDGPAYRVHRADVQRVVALVEASPLYLSQRARLVELRLAGSRRMVLSCDASELVERARQCDHVADAALWTLPLERIARKRALDEKQRAAAREEIRPFHEPTTALWRGRVSHLMGKLAGDQGAQRYYLRCRAADADIAAAKAAGKLDPASEARGVLLKQNASYWLGLVCYERGRFATALDYFQARSLAPFPDGPWTQGAWYNAGRAYEALGRTDEAIVAYRSTRGPQRHGNLLRARALAPAAP